MLTKYMRRTLTIAAVAIVLIGILVWAYFAFFSSSAPSVTVAPSGGTGLPSAGQVGMQLPAETTAPTTQTVAASAGARLVKISAGPVVPGIIVTDATSTSASSTPGFFVTYIERQSGNVFSYSSSAGTLTRTSNKTIPGIESASWLPNAASAFVRYLSGADYSTVNSYILSANGAGGSFLPQDLDGVEAGPSGVLEIASGVNGSSASLARADGTHAAEVFTTPLSDIRASFAGKNTYLVFTKPTAVLPGYAFTVNSSRRFTRIAGPLLGLSATASPSGASVLVSYVDGTGSLQMELIDTATGKTTVLPVATIADKCAWSADSKTAYCGIPMNVADGFAYPDDWYQGAVSFSDRIWKIDVAGRYAQLVLDFPKETNGVMLDAETLSIDPAGTALSFVNKSDGSLWVYKL